MTGEFEGLTDQELTALTDDQIERYVDIMCAEQGIRLLPPEPVAPEKDFPPADVTLYKVGPWFFTSPDAARKLLTWLWNLGYAAIKAAVDAYASAEGEYKALKREYDEIKEKRDKVRDHIYDVVVAARERVRRQEFLTKEFDRYLQLADGDHVIARKFFADAFAGEEYTFSED